MPRACCLLLLCALLSVSARAGEAKDLDGDSLPEGAVSRIGSLRYRLPGNGKVLAASPDGTLLAIGAEPNAVILMEARTGRVVRRFRGEGSEIHAVAFSPDGRLLASAGCEGVVLREVATGRHLWHCANSFPKAIVFVASGRALAFGEDNGNIRLLDVATGKDRGLLVGHTGKISALAATADGRTLASSERNRGVRVWDVATGKERLNFSLRHGPGKALAFAPDGRSLACGTHTGELYVWDPATGKERWHVGIVEHIPGALAFTPDGSRLLSAQTIVRNCHSLRAWDPATGRALGESPVDLDEILDLAVADGRVFATRKDGLVASWDLATLRPLNPPEGHRGPVLDLSFSPDGRILATADGYEAALWEARSGRPRLAFADGLKEATYVSFAPTGQKLAVGGPKEVEILDLVAGKRRRSSVANLRRLDGLAFLDDKRLLLAVDFYRLITVDAATGGDSQALFRGSNDPLASKVGEALRFAVAADGRTVAVESVARTLSVVHVLDVREGSSLARSEVPGVPLALTTDGKRLVLNDGVDLILIDTSTGRFVRKLEGLGARVSSVAFAPGGWELAVGIDDGEVRRYEVTTGQLREVHRGHQGAVGVLAYAPRGGLLASGSADTTALVWNVNLPVPIALLTGADLAPLWDDLASSNGVRAFQAMRRLRGDPTSAVAELRKRLAPTAAPDPKVLARLIGDLDDEAFATRERARIELEGYGPAAGPALRAVPAVGPSLELRRRVDDLLEKGRLWTESSPGRRELRVVETLERIGTPEARTLLERLGSGIEGVPLTEAARAAHRRLEPR